MFTVTTHIQTAGLLQAIKERREFYARLTPEAIRAELDRLEQLEAAITNNQRVYLSDDMQSSILLRSS